MSDEKQIDNMSDSELSAALMSEVNHIDGKTEAEPEVKTEAQPEPEAVEAKADEAATGDEGEEAVDDEGNPYRKRIDRLLRKRDNLQETLAEKEARIKELEAQISNPKGEEIEGTSETPDIISTLNRVLDERDSKSRSVQEKIKAQEEEFAKLVAKAPNATKRKAEILQLAESHPNLTFEALDRILAPEDHIDPIERNRKNAKRMEVGSRSRADLASEKDITKGSTSEMEKELRSLEASGKLVI